MEQLLLFDDLAALPRRLPYHQRDVVFFGIRLTELESHAADTLRLLRRSYNLTGIPYEPSRLHVSLLRVGHRDALDDTHLGQLREAASAVRMRPFPMAFETVMSFDGHARPNETRPLVLPVADGAAEVIALARDIEASAGRRIGLEGQPPFSPHMTLLRDRLRVPQTALDPPFGTRVTRFELICSHRRERRYATLWP